VKVPFSDIYPSNLAIEEEFIAKIKELIRSSRFVGGEEVDEFEREFADYARTKYCTGCSSGTDALTVALKSLDIGAGDLVLTTPNTFIATAEAISSSGADIDFIDVEEDYYTMDPSKLEGYLKSAKGKRVKAVIPVHLYGQMADMKKIRELADEFKIKIIEDSAQAHGASLMGNAPGYWGDCAAFSFFPAKNLGAFGDAGAIVTNNEGLYARTKQIINHGRLKEKDKHEIIGTNARLDNIQAALLRLKLRHLHETTEMRIQNANFYTEKLKNYKKIKTPAVRKEATHVYHLYVVRAFERDNIIIKLEEKNIKPGIHYPVPIHLQPAYRYLNIAEGSFPVTERLAKAVMSLPFWPQMEKAKIEYVAVVLNEICG
jgi:dTDP-4-amino-4,6-dideoxygalactose transaminase